VGFYAVKSKSLPIEPMVLLELVSRCFHSPRKQAESESFMPGVSIENLAMLPHFSPVFPD
jgi:hypothetical protein